MKITRFVENKDRFIDKNPNLTPEQKTELKAIFNKKPNLEAMMGNWQVESDKWTYEDFKPVIDEYNMTKTDKLQRKRKEQAKIKGLDGLKDGEDYEVIYNKNGVTAIWTKTHAAAARVASNSVGPEIWSKVLFWGERFKDDNYIRDDKTGLYSNAKWCIAIPNYRGHWEGYTKYGAKFLMIYSEDKYKVPTKKICVFCNINPDDILSGNTTEEDIRYCDAFEDLNEVPVERFKSHYYNVDFTDIDAAVKLWWNKVIDLTPEQKYNYEVKKAGFEKHEDGKFYDIKYSRPTYFYKDIKGLFEVEPEAKIALWRDDYRLDSRYNTPEEIAELLKHVPEEVNGSIYLNKVPVNSFKELGIKKFNNYGHKCIYIEGTNIKNFEGFPETENNIDTITVVDNPNFTSMKGIPENYHCDSITIRRCALKSLAGCPDEVPSLYCDNNNLTSLDGIGLVNRLSVKDNKLKTLKGGSNVKGCILASNNPDLADWGDVSDDVFVTHKNTKLKDEYID